MESRLYAAIAVRCFQSATAGPAAAAPTNTAAIQQLLQGRRLPSVSTLASCGEISGFEYCSESRKHTSAFDIVNIPAEKADRNSGEFAQVIAAAQFSRVWVSPQASYHTGFR